jgi:signal transduction histidine kinase
MNAQMASSRLTLDKIERGYTEIGQLRILNLVSVIAMLLFLLGFLLKIQRKAFEKIQATSVQLLQSSKLASLGELSAGIAHEINNSLAIITGTADLLLRSKDDPEKLVSKIETIKKSCGRILKIVKGLKKFSRTNDERVVHKTYDLNDICIEVQGLVEIKSKKFHTPVTFECSIPGKISCDEVQIEQVLVNLIGNAIDAVQALPEKWVKVSVSEQDQAVVLRVMDSGPGIPEKIRDKLFDPFFTTKKVGEGTGLGLSISKGILDSHGATISVVEGLKHTCFEIRFPKVEAVKNAA